MPTQTETKIARAVDVESDDVFAIILMQQNLLDVDICGLKTSEWVQRAVVEYKSARVPVKKSDDLIGIVKDHAGDKKYCIVVYSDTPLIQSETIEQALSFAMTYKHQVVQLPRGWIFEVGHIKSNVSIEPIVMPNLDEKDFLIAYSYSQIANITTYMRERINGKHLTNGVHITDPYNVYIDAMVQIGEGTKIGPGVVLRGETVIGKNCRITNFVEIKKSEIGDGTKVSHMSYIGDATVGKNCNIGCGVVFCNFDGKKKNPTVVGDNVFIGSNSNLVSNSKFILTIGDNAFIGAGSTITKNVPADALALGRAVQATKEGWRKEQGEND